ncbi:SDR family oxidoreductase [Spirochaeta thermophila]|uniref:Short-chain dehydrogenase/reductase n=1 Tax=Winmispira thermophila (strain ATCC 49972 / DSM 6192 / RI 19.B1) TaxID=665571 RepID=E0RT21_WINT6|nr:SDR family NAD(P)-dependent oxidoreductase [Spirochaeta thermophila]ADN02158.1 short-chain dehydrogenase/reductase [Spirochaeta thermophila DSM 6192]
MLEELCYAIEAQLLVENEAAKNREETAKAFAGKTAAVKGGASGIGKALCEMLLSFGAKAVTLADINEENLIKETARLQTLYPGKVFGIVTDVTNQASVVNMVKAARENGEGRLDYLFNNDGLGLTKPFDACSAEDWKYAFDVNFFGVLYGTIAAVDIMNDQDGGGSIVNTASDIAFVPMAYQRMYSATKAAVLGMTVALRYELSDRNIRLFAVAPGTVATPIFRGNPPSDAIMPDVAAERILYSVAQNFRVVITTVEDAFGTLANIPLPELRMLWEQYG